MPRKARIAELKAPGKIDDLKTCKNAYKTIYADPPWRYGDWGCQGSAEPHYTKDKKGRGTMSVKQICAVPVSSITQPSGAFLWLWTTWPMLRDKAPHLVLDAWGFRWIGEIVWNKKAFGVGRWLRPQTEILILGVKGPAKLRYKDQRGYYEHKRGSHSTKPDAIRKIIERLCEPPYIELFARSAAKGWTRWGNEA